MDKMKLVEDAAIRSLESLKASQKNKKKGSEIYAQACKNYSEYSQLVSESVFKCQVPCHYIPRSRERLFLAREVIEMFLQDLEGE